jgi:hypothetical protein
MAFSNQNLTQIEGVDGGVQSNHPANMVFTYANYEDLLKAGRFAKIDAGRLDNMDGSATPNIAGVVLRYPYMTIEDGGAYDSTVVPQVYGVLYKGLVTVDVKSGELAPVKFGKVYVSNAGDADDGLATSKVTDIDFGVKFIEEVKTGVWLVLVDPA